MMFIIGLTSPFLEGSIFVFSRIHYPLFPCVLRVSSLSIQQEFVSAVPALPFPYLLFFDRQPLRVTTRIAGIAYPTESRPRRYAFRSVDLQTFPLLTLFPSNKLSGAFLYFEVTARGSFLPDDSVFFRPAKLTLFCSLLLSSVVLEK